jgi:hypothetical protein
MREEEEEKEEEERRKKKKKEEKNIYHEYIRESSEGVGTLSVGENGVESGDLSSDSVHFDLSTEGNTLFLGSKDN